MFAAVPFLLIYCLARDGERVRIADVKITIHVVTRGNAGGSVVAGFEGVAGILRDAAGIDQSEGIQHGAAVFIQNYVFANCLANYL